MNRYLFFSLFFVSFLWVSCKEKDMLVYKDDGAPAPGPVTNLKLTSTPGGAVITYTLPKDPNLLYVKAVYELKSGVSAEAKSSTYNDTLTIGGYGDTLQHEVKVYTVGKNEKASQPVSITFKPLRPPVYSMFASLSLVETFSGANVSFKNPDEAPLAIVLMADSTGRGDWAIANTYYTAAPSGSFSVRGFDTTEHKFGVYIRDRWNNKSDTLIKKLKPLYETAIDRSGFKEVQLLGDNYAPHSWSGVTARVMSFMWNNVWNSDNDCFHTKTGDPKMPLSFTFDMGATNLLSRFKFYHRSGSSGAYVGGDPKIFEIWGSNNPSPDGSWGSWQLLGTFNSVKPSGPGAVTTEDKNFACVQGEDFDFPIDIPPVRYLRFRVLDTWGGFQYIYISELKFWGIKK